MKKGEEWVIKGISERLPFVFSGVKQKPLDFFPKSWITFKWKKVCACFATQDRKWATIYNLGS